MIDLTAKSPAHGLLPVTIGALILVEQPQTSIHSIAPFKGATTKGFPDVGRSVAYGDGRMVWSARGQFFLIGGTPPKMKAAITDQSDAWCHVALTGADAAAVLARLCPVNTAAMAQDDVVRSLIGHMTGLVIRTGDGFEIMVFRAFAKTLIHEVTGAMTALHARQNITQ